MPAEYMLEYLVVFPVRRAHGTWFYITIPVHRQVDTDRPPLAEVVTDLVKLGICSCYKCLQSHQSEAHQRHEHNHLFNTETVSSPISNRGCVYTRPESSLAGGISVLPHVHGIALDGRSCACHRGARQGLTWVVIHLLDRWILELWYDSSWLPARTSAEFHRRAHSRTAHRRSSREILVCLP